LFLAGFFCLDLKSNQLRKQLEYCEIILRELCRQKIEGAKRAKEAAMCAMQRHGYVAFYAMHQEPGVLAETRIIPCVIDQEWRDRVTGNHTSVSAVQLQPVARFQAELGFIQHGAGSPRVVRNSGDKRNTEARRAAQDPQCGLYGGQALKHQRVYVNRTWVVSGGWVGFRAVYHLVTSRAGASEQSDNV